MNRRALPLAWVMFVFVSASTCLIAQDSGAPSGSPQGQPGMRRAGGEPCWQVAGVEKSVMEQRWAIERDTHSQVSAVCSNTSLTPQQKRAQVQEIRQQGKQKMDALMTPEQEKSLVSCQQSRGMNHGGGGEHEMGGGCGEWSRQRPNAATGSSTPAGSASSPQN